jgi:hypothetical protein
VPEIGVPSKQPRGFDKECPWSPWEIASTVTINVKLCGHDILLWWCANVLPCRKLPCDLEKEKDNKSK